MLRTTLGQPRLLCGQLLSPPTSRGCGTRQGQRLMLTWSWVWRGENRKLSPQSQTNPVGKEVMLASQSYLGPCFFSPGRDQDCHWLPTASPPHVIHVLKDLGMTGLSPSRLAGSWISPLQAPVSRDTVELLDFAVSVFFLGLSPAIPIPNKTFSTPKRSRIKTSGKKLIDHGVGAARGPTRKAAA